MKPINSEQASRTTTSSSIATFFWGGGLLLIIAVYLTQIAIFTSPMPSVDDIQIFDRISQLKTAPWSDVPGILWEQHNEHRPVLLCIIEATYHYLFGFLNLKYLTLLGNLFLIAAFFVVVYGLAGPFRAASLPIYTITALVFFAQRFWDLSMWPMATLSGFAALFFGVLACTLLGKEKPVTGFFSAVLAVLSQGNGLFALIAGGVILLRQKKYRQFFVWSILSGLMFFAYFHNYVPTHFSQTNTPLPLVQFFFILWSNVLPWQIFIPIPNLMLVTLVGLAIFAAFIYALVCDKKPNSPLIGYLVFFTLSMAAIAHGRLAFGVESATLVMRYTLIPITATVAGLAFVLDSHRSSVSWQAALTILAGVFYFATGYNAYDSYRNLPVIAKGAIQCKTGVIRNVPLVPGFEAEFQAMMIQALELGIFRLHDELSSYCPPSMITANPIIVSPEVQSDRVAMQIKGHVDSVKRRDNSLIIEGWGPMDAFAETNVFTPIISISSFPTKTENFAFGRPDLANVFPDEAATLTGFRITLQFQDSLQADQALASFCVATLAKKHFYMLANQRPECYSRHHQ